MSEGQLKSSIRYHMECLCKVEDFKMSENAVNFCRDYIFSFSFFVFLGILNFCMCVKLGCQHHPTMSALAIFSVFGIVPLYIVRENLN